MVHLFSTLQDHVGLESRLEACVDQLQGLRTLERQPNLKWSKERQGEL